MHVVGVDVALVPQGREHIVYHFLMVLGVGGGEEIEGDAQLLPRLQEHGVVTLDHFLGADAFLVSADGDGSAVGVAAGDHQHFVAFHAVVAGKNVGAQVAASNMPQMKRTVGIGPGHGHKYAFRQRDILFRICGFGTGILSSEGAGSPKAD